MVITDKPKIKDKRFKFLFTPSYLDIHHYSKGHRHINLTYFVKSKSNKVVKSKK